MNWGIKIIIAYLVFIAIMAFLVIRSFNEDIELVTDDYYNQELRYEEKIQQLKNTNSLEEKAELNLSEKGIEIKFPNDSINGGQIALYRPSNADLDREFMIEMNAENIHVIDWDDVMEGKYMVKLDYTIGQKQYYQEIPLFVAK